LIHIRRFVGQWTQNGPAFILYNQQAPHEWGALRQDIVLTLGTVCNTRCSLGISYHFYRSDLVHPGANWVVLMMSQLCNQSTWLQTRSGGKSRRKWCHRIQNMSLFALRCF
jgi:hypothetical protein